MNSRDLLPASAYFGFAAAMLAALSCNAFLDLQYGSFTAEMIAWALVNGLTLWVGWRQRHGVTATGKAWQKVLFLLGLLLFFSLFRVVWGMPRAGLYLLAMLQASYNCIMTERRQFYLGLSVSLALVMFATAHSRADWTLLFYLIPYLIAAVFTWVVIHIHQRGEALRKQSLAAYSTRGQLAAVAAATAILILIGTGLYLLTPQVTWPYLQWRYGQSADAAPAEGQVHNKAGGRNTSDQHNGTAQATQGEMSLHRWPSPQEMRAAAKRPHMPKWQAQAIRTLADVSESLQQQWQPIGDALEALADVLQQQLKQLVLLLLRVLFLLAALLTVGGYVALITELPIRVWFKMHWDYGLLALMRWQRQDHRAVCRYYRAMTRFFAFHDVPRAPTENARDYLANLQRWQKARYALAAEMTELFEHARYDNRPFAPQQLDRMRQLYRALYRSG